MDASELMNVCLIEKMSREFLKTMIIQRDKRPRLSSVQSTMTVRLDDNGCLGFRIN